MPASGRKHSPTVPACRKQPNDANFASDANPNKSALRFLYLFENGYGMS